MSDLIVHLSPPAVVRAEVTAPAGTALVLPAADGLTAQVSAPDVVQALVAAPVGLSVRLVAEQGPPGPPGPPGPAGPPGPPLNTYVHVQTVPSDVWVIDHHLGHVCDLTVLDSGGNLVEGDVQAGSMTSVARFSVPFAGIAYAH